MAASACHYAALHSLFCQNKALLLGIVASPSSARDYIMWNASCLLSNSQQASPKKDRLSNIRSLASLVPLVSFSMQETSQTSLVSKHERAACSLLMLHYSGWREVKFSLPLQVSSLTEMLWQDVKTGTVWSFYLYHLWVTDSDKFDHNHSIFGKWNRALKLEEISLVIHLKFSFFNIVEYVKNWSRMGIIIFRNPKIVS